MTVWGAAVLAVVFLVGGVLSMHTGIKTGRPVYIWTGITLLLPVAICVLYLGAAWLLLGGRE